MPLQNNATQSTQESAFCRHRENLDDDIARCETFPLFYVTYWNQISYINLYIHNRSAKNQAKEEWDNVVTVEPIYQANFFSVSHVTYQQAFNYFRNLDLSQYMVRY